MLKRRININIADKIVAQTVADMSFEGLICNETDKMAMYRIARGETTAKEEVQKVLEKYR